MRKIELKDNFRVRESLVNSDRLVFVFTGMGTKIGLYRLFVELLNKKGYGVVIYDYPARIVLKAEFEAYEPLYKAIKADVDERIKRIKPKHAYTYGVSMGTIIAARLTRNTPDIKHVIMSLTYGDITTNMMHSWVNRPTRKNMKAKGLTVSDLREAVTHYDSIVNVSELKNKKVWLHLSRRDRMLNYKITVKTKEAFEANIKNLKYTEDKVFGHVLAGTRHILNIDAIDKFYKS